MVSLTSLINLISEQSSVAALYPKRCLRKRLNTNNCSMCVDVCRSGALSLQGRQIVLDEHSCTGCMACVSACPQDALAAECEPLELLDALYGKPNTNILVSCYRQKQLQPEEITVPCLGIFSKPILAVIGLGNLGAVTFNMVGCSDCPNSYASQIFKSNCNEVMTVLSNILVTELSVITKTCGHVKKPRVDRRSYLAIVQKSFSKATRNCIVPDARPHDPSAKHSRRVPYKTKLIRNLIQNVNAESRTPLLTLFGHGLSADDSCNLCPLCKGICPTGALNLKRNEKGAELFFSHLICSGCGLCVEFCKKNALSLERYQLNTADGDTVRIMP